MNPSTPFTAHPLIQHKDRPAFFGGMFNRTPPPPTAAPAAAPIPEQQAPAPNLTLSLIHI